MELETKQKMRAFYSGQIKCSVEWTIEDFKNLPEKKGDLIFSDTFEIHEPDGKITEWQMYIFPKGVSTAQDGYISLFLSTFSSFDEKINYMFSILDASGKKQNSIIYKDQVFERVGDGVARGCVKKRKDSSRKS